MYPEHQNDLKCSAMAICVIKGVRMPMKPVCTIGNDGNRSELRAEIQQLKKNTDDNQRIIHVLVSGELNQEYQSSGQRALIGDKSEGVVDILSRAWLVYMTKAATSPMRRPSNVC